MTFSDLRTTDTADSDKLVGQPGEFGRAEGSTRIPAWLHAFLAALAVVSGAWAWRGIHVSLWRDEVATASAASRSLPELLHLLTREDPGLAAYYLFMHVWTSFFGTSEVALRMPSLIAVVISIYLLGIVGHRLGGPAAGLAAGVLFALAPHYIAIYAVEARAYALVVCLVTAAALCSIQVGRGRGGRVVLASWSVLASLAIAFDVLAAAAVVPQLFWLLRADASVGRRRTWPAFILPIVVGAGALVMAHRGSSLQNWIPATEGTEVIRAAVGLVTIGGIVLIVTSIPGLILLVRAVDANARGRTVSDLGVALCWAILPFIALLAYSVVIAPSFIARYYLTAVPGATVFVALVASASLRGILHARAAANCESGGRRVSSRITLPVLALGASVALLAPLALHELDFVTYEDLRGAANFISQRDEPGDGIVYAPTFAQSGLDWYLRGPDMSSSRAPRDVLAARDDSAFASGSLWTPTLPAGTSPKVALNDVNRVWITDYTNPGTWNPVPDVSSSVAAAVKRCWTPGAKFTPSSSETMQVQLWVRPARPSTAGCGF